jgi:hypothetical protein
MKRLGNNNNNNNIRGNNNNNNKTIEDFMQKMNFSRNSVKKLLNLLGRI